MKKSTETIRKMIGSENLGHPMEFRKAKRMTQRKDPKDTPSRSKRRSVKELLEAAKDNEKRALKRFEQKNAAVQKYESLQKRRDRKLDTRRKIIAGALALEHMKHDAVFADAFHQILDRYVTKSPERMLFGLVAAAQTESDTSSENS